MTDPVSDDTDLTIEELLIMADKWRLRAGDALSVDAHKLPPSLYSYALGAHDAMVAFFTAIEELANDD